MKKIYDEDKIKKVVEKSKYRELLNSIDVDLFLIEYDAEEFISSPWNDESIFQIVISGELNIYIIRDDGSRYSLANGGENYIIGDMDLFDLKPKDIYAEVTKKVMSIGFSVEKNREKLFDNSLFMRIIAESLAKKMDAVTTLDAEPSSLSDRVMSYMRFKCEDEILKGIEKAAFQLHCSSRHLQRILNDYEKQGIVEKIGKGKYKLKNM